MSRVPTFADLNEREWEHLQQAADRLADAWQLAAGTAVVDLNVFAPRPGDRMRPVILCELVKTDLEIRWRRGRSTLVEHYLESWPELSEDLSVLPMLLYEEYRARQLYGDKPDLEQYRERFPEQFAALQEQLGGEPIPAPAAPRKKITPLPVPAVDSSDDVPIGGDYRPVKRLGRGSYGEVWQALAPDGLKLAVKVIRRQIERTDASREQQTLERLPGLRHPHLLRIHACQSLPDRILIATELADSSLRDLLEASRRAGRSGFPRKELLPYFREAAEALDYLHNQGVFHRNIKLENLLVLKGHAKVADFGLDRLPESHSVADAPFHGAPRFIPPEGWRGQFHTHSDQYSLALVYAELRLGRAVFPDGDGARVNFLSVMLAHLQGCPDLGDLPPAEQGALARALDLEPDQRYPDCLSLVRALEAAASSR